MSRFFTTRLFFVSFLVAMVGVGAAKPAPADEQGTLSITGRAEVTATPDLATITMGVVSQAKTAAEALSDNNDRLAGVFAVLSAAGIEDQDRQTSGLTVQPNWVYPSSNVANRPPRITGYTVSNRLTVRIRDLERLGEILDAVVRDGANKFEGLRFSVIDPGPLLEQARKAAAADALRTAQLYAEALGIGLGPVRRIAENDREAQPMMIRAEAMRAADRAQNVPVASGEVRYSSTVNITWLLEQ